MKILFLIGRYPSYGGTEKVTTVLANEFHRQGYSVHIASFEQPLPELISELHKDIHFYPLSLPVKSEANLQRLRGIIVEQHIDVIINQWCLPFYVTQLCNKARRGTNCKLISVHHNQPNFNARIEKFKMLIDCNKNPIKRTFLKLGLTTVQKATSMSVRYVYKHSDRYVLLSNSFINLFKELTGIKNADKLEVITNPITIDIDNNIESDKVKEIIYVGRIDYNQKKVYRIVELWKDLFLQYADWKLTLVGDGPQKNEIEKLITDWNLQRISVTGFQNPVSFYTKATILLLTSEYEGFPLVIAEGMSYGVVLIVYGSYPAVYDIIEHGKNGFITNKPYSKQETVEYLKMLMNDEALRNKMAHEAQKIADKFSIENIVKKWEKLFEDIK
jgi:glycosyltransferase involved in cell wall biosynthesis